MFASQKPYRGIQLNRSHPLARGLVGCWVMNEGSGDSCYDLSGNGNDGSLINSPAWVGGSIEFIATDDDYISLGDSFPLSSLADGSFSLCSLVKTSASLERDNIARRDNVDTQGGEARRIALLAFNAGKPEILIYDGAQIPAAASATSFADGRWHSVVGVRDVGSDKLYIYADGKYENSAIDTTTVSINTVHEPWVIGTTNTVNPRELWDGNIALVYIYNRAITASEVAWLHREPYAMFVQPSIPQSLYAVTIPITNRIATISTYNYRMRRLNNM